VGEGIATGGRGFPWKFKLLVLLPLLERVSFFSAVLGVRDKRKKGRRRRLISLISTTEEVTTCKERCGT
jgi:hypothetical protein